MNEIIKKAIENTKRLVPGHWDTLLGERPAGSKWGRAFTEADFELPWADATDELDAAFKMDGCRYFRLENAKQHFPNLAVRVVRLGLLRPKELSEVRICEGSHGDYLGICETDLIDDDPFLADDNTAWLILGQEQGEDVVFTAHPGPVLLPYPKEGIYEIDALPGDVAVKVGTNFKTELVD